MPDSDTRKRLLVVMRHSPYGSSRSRAGLDTALAAAAFDQPVELLFMGEGVLQLLPAQQSAGAGLKSTAKQLASLPLCDVERVFADGRSLARHGVDPATAPLPVEVIDGDTIAELLADSDLLLGF
jgi:tRNA 2-thiouridine synthesizing protein C